ncbi:capsular polysaccharide transport system permease protein [Nitrosospira multiformis]|uniref:Capsular polysaccharide transport system permease protein n=1 Tax=Nitrosospira multiformis TaxID=1231 RepID=A0A1H8NX35_9PROT|nr:chain-length determining protein [Nitrosospira multiformis]SEO34141.1 capsular polysaccharide transport system permease protein [Nitrosospira multiformis]
MTTLPHPSRFGQIRKSLIERVQHLITLQLLRRHVFRVAAIASVTAALYWILIASDRYVSEGHIVIQHTDLTGSQSTDVASLLGGIGGINRADQLLLRDHLLSADMLQKLDAKLNLRSHYSDWSHDLLSRMWFENASIEKFHDYYLSRVSVELDDYSGILVIKAQAYDPKIAHGITGMLVAEGEQFMNAMSHDLAQEQVDFLEKQVAKMGERTIESRQGVLRFQNENGLLSPQGTAENIAGIVNDLESRLAELRTRRSAMLGYLMPNSPDLKEIALQIAAVEKQINKERTRLATPNGNALNRKVEEFQRLQLNAEFAQDIYKTTLMALEKGRVEATRTLKKVSVLQTPSKPQYPLEPRRIYNSIISILFALFVAGIIHLLAAIIRDHKD